uniref:Uncharacterized protein n=1 Tax=Digenea simplex TaxID=945030 RepID=A0A1Z1MTS8_DIGSM|nr:hypothetical protein [Digenea simplex]ARW69507.1 hypothetical protein [Digenea simplex]
MINLSLSINLSLYCYQAIAVLFISVIIFFNVLKLFLHKTSLHK